MANVFSASHEYRQIQEKWYNNRQRALEDLAGLDPTTFNDPMLFIAKVVSLQSDARIWKQAADNLSEYFEEASKK